jgi:AcrR family transcriptional regulator
MEAATTRATRHLVADEQLLDAATAVFAAEGFGRATMEAISARADVTKPTLYARFGSKEDLFAAAVQREYEIRKARLFAAYAAPDEEQPFRRRLHGWVTAYFDLVRERPDGFLLIPEGERHPRAAAVIDRASHEVTDRIAELVTSISGRQGRRGARLVASIIAGMLTSCAREAVRAPVIDMDRAAAVCESLLYGALRGLDPELIDAVG